MEPKSAQKRAPPTPTVRPAAQKIPPALDMAMHSANSTPAHGPHHHKSSRQAPAAPPLQEEGYRFTDNEVQERVVLGTRHGILDAHLTSHLHMRRLDLSHGAAYRVKPIVARHAWAAPQGGVAAANMCTTHICMTINFRPSAWQEGDVSDEEDGHGGASASASSLGKIFGWHSPRMLRGDTLRGLEELAKTYVNQYSGLIPSKKQLTVDRCINVKPDDITASLRSLRQDAGAAARIVFHYNGHGVSRPRGNFLFLGHTNNAGENSKYTLDMIRSNVQYPLVFIADCQSAGSIFHYLCDVHRREDEQSMQHYRSSGGTQLGVSSAGGGNNGQSAGGGGLGPASAMQRSSVSALDLEPSSSDASGPGNDSSYPRSGRGAYPPGSLTGSPVVAQMAQPFGAPPTSAQIPARDDFFFIGACKEALPFHPMLPNDWLTSCLTTPVTMSLLWCIVSTRSIADLHPALIHVLPGALEDKKSPLGQLRWAFDSFAESIAWATLRSDQNLFTKLFRQDFLLSGLFRGALLAQRIASHLNSEIIVYPTIHAKDHENHPLWDAFEYHVERALAALTSALQPQPSPLLSSSIIMTQHYHRWQYSNLYTRSQSGGTGAHLHSHSSHNSLAGCRAFREALDKSTALMTLAADRGIDHHLSPLAGVSAIVDASEVNISPHFLNEELTTIDTTLDSLIDQGFYRFTPGGGSEMVPLLTGLPMIAQGLLVLSHREEAIRLLCRFIDLGALALEQLVELNLYSEALKNLWRHPKSVGHRTALMFLYAKAMYQDPAVLSDDTRGVAIPIVLSFLNAQVPLSEMIGNAASAWQVSTLRGFATPVGQVCLASAIVAMTCSRSPQGQTFCVQQGALEQCINALATHCPPQSPPMGPRERGHQRGGAGPYYSGGTEESPAVTNIESADLQVLLRLSLLAMLCSLVFNCPLQHDVSVGHFANLMLSCVPSLRGLLSYPFPSVRLAATRTIAIVLSHASIDATMEPSSPLRDNSNNNSNDDANQASEQGGDAAASGRRVRQMVCELLQAILERSDAVSPFECNTDIRLEQLGILHSVLQRYGVRCIGGFTTQELQRRMTAGAYQSAGAAGLAPPSSSVIAAYPPGSARGVTAYHEVHQQRDILASSIMSPFVLPQTQSLSARTLHLDDSDDDQQHSRGPPRLPVTVPRSLPQRAFDAVVAPILGQQAPKKFGESELTVMLCSALRVIACAAGDICPVVRGHAESSLQLLKSAQVIPREQMAWGTAASLVQRGSIIDRNQPSVGSKKPSGIFSIFRNFGKAPRTEARATPPVRGTGGAAGGAGYRYEDGIDEEDSPALRLVDHRDAATIHPLVFSVLSYLGTISLVPLDDHDPRNPMRASVQHKTERFSAHVMRGIELSSRPQYESNPHARKDQLTLAPLIERDVEAPVSALALHPTVPVVAVATNVDRLIILTYDSAGGANPSPQESQQQRPKYSFHTSTVPRTWKEQCQPFVMPGGPSDPFSGFRAAAYVQAQQGQQQQQQSSGSNFDTGSDVDSLTDGSMALTPHAHHRSSLAKDGGVPLPSSTTSAATASMSSASPITDLHFLDCHRPTPLLAAVHQNGSVAVVALNTDLMTLHPQHPQAMRTYDNGANGAAPVGSYAIRISSFQTMPVEHRNLSTSCVSTYQSASQQLHVTCPDGTISTWDLSVEQLVGLHNATAAPHAPNQSLDLEGSITTPYSHHQYRGPMMPTALGSHPLDPFRFVSGCRAVSIFDTRILGGCVQRMLLPKSTAPATNSVCWHVGYSIRCDHYLSAGYAFKGTVLTWDDRMNRGPLLHHAFTAPAAGQAAAPPTPVHQAGTTPQLFSPNVAVDATCMDMHPTHTHTAVAAATTDSLWYHELGTGLMANVKCKGSPKCCVFHPLAPRIAVGTTANRVAVYRPADNSVSSIATDMLSV